MQNLFPTNLPTIRMVREKEDVGEVMVPKARAKPKVYFYINPHERPMTKAKVVAWPLHKINLFN
jgi:hypothetical protein